MEEMFSVAGRSVRGEVTLEEEKKRSREELPTKQSSGSNDQLYWRKEVSEAFCYDFQCELAKVAKQPRRKL